MILILKFPFLNGDVPRSPSYGVYILQLIRFARVCSNVAELFLFCYMRDGMISLSDDKQACVINAINTTSRYSDDILNINNVILTIWYVKCTLQSSNLIKPMPLIKKPHF